MSLFGFPGIIRVPTATTLPVGMADLTISNVQQPGLWGNMEFQRNVFVSVGFIPRLTVFARGTVTRDTIDHGELRDLSVGAQLLVVRERTRLPAIALGMTDPDSGGETPYFTTYYVTATKTLFNRARVTTGFGLGPKEPEGVFGGLELELGSWATAQGEFDGERWNAGVRLSPFPGTGERWGVQPRLDVLHREGVGQAIGVGLRVALGGPRPRPRSSAPARSASSPLPPSDQGAEALSRALVDFGFENVQVALRDGAAGATGASLAVAYENRIFNRDEWDALGVVMGLVARHAPGSATRMSLTILRLDTAVLTVACDIAAFRSFIDGVLPARAFAEQMEIMSPRANGGVAGADPPAPANPTGWKLDLFLRPRTDLTLLTEAGWVGTRLALLPDAYLHLGRGWVLNVRATVPISQSDGFPGFVEDANSDRLLLHKVWRPELGSRWPSANVVTQLSLGWFRHDRPGVAHEIDVLLGDGRVSVGSTLAAYRGESGKLDSGVALGNVRVRHPGMDLTVTLEAGVFREGDPGVRMEVSRFFGDTEGGFFVRSTRFGSVAGGRLSLPLTTSRELPPARVRLRLPDLYTHRQQITILEYPSVVKRYVGRDLETDHELERVVRGRGRLQGSDLRAHAETLRSAVLRWLP